MKITNLSLAAIAAMAFTTGAVADVDLKTGGQAVVYYQTMDGKNVDMFSQESASANAGVQLDLTGDLGNDFGVGVQGTALNTFGLEGNLVDGVMQSGLGTNGDTTTAGDYFAVTKAYLTKKIANTTLSLGRQELPQALSPFAFSEDWNVFKNTFDGMLAINSDLPDTTLVGAYVSKANLHGDLSTFAYINPKTDAAGQNQGVYMLTAQNNSVEGLTPTVTYYNAESLANVVWGDVAADFNKLAGAPVTFGLQGGQISPDAAGANDTKAIGAKIAGNAAGADLSVAYSKVNNGAVPIHNLGTGVKTPLYTQMILNQNAIKNGADTFVLKAVMPVGPGKAVAQYGSTTANTGNLLGKDNDYQELDLIYTFKALGADMLAAYVMQKTENPTISATGNKDNANAIRLWTRYNF